MCIPESVLASRASQSVRKMKKLVRNMHMFVYQLYCCVILISSAVFHCFDAVD